MLQLDHSLCFRSFAVTATDTQDSAVPTATVLYLSLELGQNTWKLAFTVGAGQKPRLRSVWARDLQALLAEIVAAKVRFGLPEGAKVISCYEAGRDGFWIHRFLLAQNVENIVVDSASIEVNRRKRRAKSDRLDAVKLVTMLVRWCNGETKLRAEGTTPAEAWWRAVESARCVTWVQVFAAGSECTYDE
jgi:transposase